VRSLLAEYFLFIAAWCKSVRLLAACVILICCAPVTEAQVSLDDLRASAAEGNVEALNEMGNRLANGQGVARSDQKAIQYYSQAADLSYAPASFNLGMMHELGRGVPKNIGQAFSYYLKAAQQGFSPAQFNVGNMYAKGACGLGSISARGSVSQD